MYAYEVEIYFFVPNAADADLLIIRHFPTISENPNEIKNVFFCRITNATMRFFNTNCSGRVLNRFSKDMGAIDEKLPYVLIDTIQV